ncbi:MAG: phenylalanine--tRNA ligase subunit alpha, partial [Candidatus Andersenbacteria bacterium]|nr:phenylalanine--tRNA ligase subunit alpha [Candidatus Andersenbacteria bacterium]
MTDKPKQLQSLHHEATKALAKIGSIAELEAWRVTYIGRKGSLTLAIKEVGELPQEERKAAGQIANQIREEVMAAFEAKEVALGGKPATETTAALPAGPGHIHPLTLTMRRIQDIFSAMGFTIVEGPEVEEQ